MIRGLKTIQKVFRRLRVQFYEVDFVMKISVDNYLPEEDGKYVVYTKTSHGNGNVFRTTFHWNNEGKKPKPRWGCTNQIVTHWIKEV